jgi:hypothetical protein
MKTRLTSTSSTEPLVGGFPDADELAVLRAWYAGSQSRGTLPATVHRGRAVGAWCPRRSSPTVGGRCRRGRRCTSLRRRSVRIVRKPSGSSCGRLSSGGGRCHHRGRLRLLRILGPPDTARVGWGRRDRVTHPTGARSLTACWRVRPPMRYPCSGRCSGAIACRLARTSSRWPASRHGCAHPFRGRIW